MVRPNKEVRQLQNKREHVAWSIVVRMMASSATTKAQVSSTPAGLLTAGEVSARYAEMRRRVNLFIPTSACLFRAMGDLCASAVMSPGGQTWLPESVSSPATIDRAVVAGSRSCARLVREIFFVPCMLIVPSKATLAM